MSEPQQSYSEADLLSAGAQLCYIYTLHASNDPQCRPRYVGFTINPKSRENSHNRIEKNGRKARWVEELKKVKAKAVLSIIYTFRSDDISERGIMEATWIELYREKFSDLLNDHGGGHGLSRCSESARLNMKRAAKERCSDPSYRARISGKIKQLWKDPEIRSQMVAANQKTLQNPIVRTKMLSYAQTRWKSQEERIKQSCRLKAVYTSPEQRAEMSKRFKKGWDKEGARERMSLENKRRLADPSYRKRLSESAKVRHGRKRLEKLLNEF
jgi:hypothetical protein